MSFHHLPGLGKVYTLTLRTRISVGKLSIELGGESKPIAWRLTAVPTVNENQTETRSAIPKRYLLHSPKSILYSVSYLLVAG